MASLSLVGLNLDFLYRRDRRTCSKLGGCGQDEESAANLTHNNTSFLSSKNEIVLQ